MVQVFGSICLLGNSSNFTANVLELKLNGVILGERSSHIRIGKAFSLCLFETQSDIVFGRNLVDWGIFTWRRRNLIRRHGN
jgi:hypothetical protein